MKASNIEVGMKVFVKGDATNVGVPKSFTKQVATVVKHDPSVPDWKVEVGEESWWVNSEHIRNVREGDKGGLW